MENKKELKPIFENVKSYYKKAYIINKYNKNNNIINKIILKSYDTNILYIKDNKIYFNYKNINNKKIYSQTTLRHIKEFIKQYYYILSLNYGDIVKKEKITKKDINDLIKAN